MAVRLTWTDCDEAGDYVVPYKLSPRDLVSRPDNMNETVLHTYWGVDGTRGYFFQIIGGAFLALAPIYLRQCKIISNDLYFKLCINTISCHFIQQYTCSTLLINYLIYSTFIGNSVDVILMPFFSTYSICSF